MKTEYLYPKSKSRLVIKWRKFKCPFAKKKKKIGPYLPHMKVLGLEVKLELELLATQLEIQATSVAYAATQGNARSITH